jgi:hypothetical protein
LAQALLTSILDQLDGLRPEELHLLEEAVRERLRGEEIARNRAALHQALLAAGLVREIRPPRNRSHKEFQGISATGEPVSETILEERR